MSLDKIDRANSCLEVLKKYGEHGKGTIPRALCAFQVLNYHPKRNQLIADYGPPGKGGGSQANSSSHWIMRGLMLLQRYGLVEYHYVTTSGMAFVVKDEIVIPSNRVMAFYQLTVGGLKGYLKFDEGLVKLMGPDNKEMAAYGTKHLEEDRIED